MDGSGSLACGKDRDRTLVTVAHCPDASPTCPTFMGSFCLSTAGSVGCWDKESVSSPGIPSFSGHCPLPKGSCLAHAYTSLQGQPAFHNWLVLGLGETQRTISLPQYRTIQDPLKGPFKLHPCPPRISWGLWFNCITVQFLHLSCPVSSTSLRKDSRSFPECLVSFCGVTTMEEDRGGKQLVEGLKLEVKWKNKWRRQKEEVKSKYFLLPPSHVPLVHRDWGEQMDPNFFLIRSWTFVFGVPHFIFLPPNSFPFLYSSSRFM